MNILTHLINHRFNSLVSTHVPRLLRVRLLVVSSLPLQATISAVRPFETSRDFKSLHCPWICWSTTFCSPVTSWLNHHDEKHDRLFTYIDQLVNGEHFTIFSRGTTNFGNNILFASCGWMHYLPQTSIDGYRITD